MPQPSTEREGSDAERWMSINGRRWRRTDPCLPDDLVAVLKSHLGRARSRVRTARDAGDDDAVAAARRRVGLAKLGLGERGPYWWERPAAERVAQAQHAAEQLDSLSQA